jgi:hypothetical protein
MACGSEMMIIIIQFNSIYLPANLAHRPITKRARVEKEKNTYIQTNKILKQSNNNNNNNNNPINTSEK